MSEPAPPARAPRRRPPPWVLASAVALAGLAATAAAWSMALRQHEDAERMRFDRIVERTVEAVQGSFGVTEGLLRGAQGLFAASRSVEPAEWSDYVASIVPGDGSSGIHVVVWFERVPQDGLAAFEDGVRATDPSFRVLNPAGADAPDHRILRYAAPAARARGLIGYDASAVAAQRHVLDAAASADRPLMSGRRRLAAEHPSEWCTVAYLPVFPRGERPTEPSARLAAATGWVAAVVRVPPFLETALRDVPRSVDVEFFEGLTPTSDSLLYDRDGHLRDGAEPRTVGGGYGRHLETQRAFVVGGRPWTLRASSLAEFESEYASRTPDAVLAAGLLATTLAAALVASLASTRRRAERLAEERSASLRRALADVEAQRDLVRAQAAELEKARDDALAATRAKSEFLAVVSHELRTPLNGVVGMTSLLADTRLTPEQREYADHVRASADQLLAIVNDVLDFSKAEAGRIDLESRPTDLRVLCEEAARTVRPAAAAKQLGLESSVDAAVPASVLCDGLRVRQVLVNLLGNAVKFSSKGTIRLSVRAAPDGPGRVRVAFEVADEGIGIDPADLPRLFEPFTQADASTTRRFGGTGLGLAICRKLADRMGGSIAATSAPGRGSTFRFEMPAAVPEGGVPTAPR